MKKSVAPLRIFLPIFGIVMLLVFFGSMLMTFVASPLGLIFAGLVLLWIAKVL